MALLKATRQYAQRMLLLCQAGRIHVPSNYQPLLASLEGSIAEALAPRGGSFHPKVWFLRYLTDEGRVVYRFLCLSRNMTFDRSWDTMLSLEGELSDRTNAFSRNHPLGEFVEALPAMLQRKLTRTWKKRIDQLAYELRRVDFAAPEPFVELNYWPLGATTKNAWPFPDRIDRMLVISPFADADFLGELAQYGSPMQLVSRLESLASLTPEELAPCEKLWILDETAEPESTDPGELEETPADNATQELTNLPLLGLHAKTYVADIGWDSHIWTGSANATNAAFDKNVEFLVELRGRKSKCGTKAILNRAESDDRAQVVGLADLLREFVPGSSEVVATAEEEAFERLADKLAKQIAARAPIAHCEPAETDLYSLIVRPTKRGSIDLPAGYSLKAWPISLTSELEHTASIHSAEWCRIERVSLIGLTAFFAWKLTSPDRQFHHQFVLNIPLENAPANRSECILRHLLSDRERVLRFLLLLLIDPGAHDFARFLGASFDPHRDDGPLHAFSESTLFESMIRALDRHPELIDQVEQTIVDLEQSPEGRQLLPTSLHEVWNPIRQVRRQQRENLAKSASADR